MKKAYIPPHIEVVTLEDDEVASMRNPCKTGDSNGRFSPADECADDSIQRTGLDACLDDAFFQPCKTFGS